MGSFLARLVTADTGISSKRVAALFSLFVITVIAISNLYWGFIIERFIFDALYYITIGGLGLTSAERIVDSLSSKPKSEDTSVKP